MVLICFYDDYHCLIVKLLYFFFVDEHEYCPFETFYGKCPNDEIILITHARYGRMRVGKCIVEGLGNKLSLMLLFIVMFVNDMVNSENARERERKRERGKAFLLTWIGSGNT